MELKPIMVQFHTILNNVLFPITEQKLLLDLADYGYQPAQVGHIIANQLIIQKGDLAVKKNTVLTINPQTQMIQVSGLTPEEVYSTWKEIEKILLLQKVNLKSSGRLFELRSQYHIKTANNPIKIIQNIFKSLKLQEKFDKILNDKPASLISLRFLPKDGVVDTENFFDIKIEPLLQAAKNEYYVSFMYRNAKQEKSEKLLVNHENKIKEIMNLIEK